MSALMESDTSLEKISQKNEREFVFKTEILEGVFNNNYLLEDKEGNDYVLKIPKENSPQINLIREEFEGVGYVTEGSEYRFRNIEEQVAFIERLRRERIPVTEVVDFGERYMLSRFVEGISLEKFLNQTDHPIIISDYFSSVNNAHHKGIFIGERWGPNTIVTPDQKIVHIDFNIELTAEDGREMEITQLFYYSILQSKNKRGAVKIISDFVNSDQFRFYDRDRVIDLLAGHRRYFENHPKYGGIGEKVSQLLDHLKTDSKSTSSATEKESTMIFTLKNKRYRIPLDPEVAKPDLYSQFLAEQIIPKPGGEALHIGVGGGIHEVVMIDFYGFKKVDGVDINPAAVQLANQTIASKGLENVVKIFLGEFPEDFKADNSYDLVISDPPQIPTPPNILPKKNGFWFTNEGGYDGREVVDKIIKNVFPYIKKGGHFQILHADFIGVKRTCDLLRNVGLEPTVIARRKARPGKFTTSRMDYIESLGYRFQKDAKGPYFYLTIITGEK